MKHLIRASMKQARERHAPRRAVSQSKIICRKLASASEFKAARTILFYLPVKNEVNTIDAIKHAISLGKTIAVPAIEKNRLVSKRLDFKKLKTGTFGIPEPSGTGTVRKNQLDLIVVPGVAFDLHGGRIGYGKGYYDSYLKHLPDATTIALAYDFQVLDHFPKEPHDVLVDKIITNRRIINCKKYRRTA